MEGKQSENYMEQFKQKKNEQIKDKVKLVKNNSNQKAYEDEQMKQSKRLEGGHHSHSKESKNLDEVAKQFKEGKTSYGDKRRLSDRSNEEDEEAKKFEVIGVGVIEQLRGNKKENLKKKQLKLAKEFISNKRRYRGKKKNLDERKKQEKNKEDPEKEMNKERNKKADAFQSKSVEQIQLKEKNEYKIDEKSTKCEKADEIISKHIEKDKLVLNDTFSHKKSEHKSHSGAFII